MGKSTSQPEEQPQRGNSLTSLESLKNLTGVNAQALRAAGITSTAQLHDLGSVAAYVHVKRAGINVSLNLLYALEGAICDMNWADLPYAVRASLTLEADAYLASEGLR